MQKLFVKNKQPLVSVVMSTFNHDKYLSNTIDSILLQTFQDFELIVINDGSSDRTESILSEYQDKDDRIKIVNHQNKGLTSSLNIGIKLAKGMYIARQDDDDISLNTNKWNKLLKKLNNN